MKWLEKLSNSADLASGMMRRLGIDYDKQLGQHPDLGALVYRGAVLRCARCPNPEDCAARQAANRHLDAAPDYCRNADLMNWMARS